jgi:hypothetical protein
VLLFWKEHFFDIVYLLEHVYNAYPFVRKKFQHLIHVLLDKINICATDLEIVKLESEMEKKKELLLKEIQKVLLRMKGQSNVARKNEVFFLIWMQMLFFFYFSLMKKLLV